jgi:hypothetical protein
MIFEVGNIDEIKKVIQDNITLKNPDKSIHYLGLGYIKSLADWVGDNYQTLNITFICDCDDDPSLVQAAMKMGFKNILFTGSIEYFEKLKQIAAQYQINLSRSS